MKTISQSEIISIGYRLVGDNTGFKTAKKPSAGTFFDRL